MMAQSAHCKRIFGKTSVEGMTIFISIRHLLSRTQTSCYSIKPITSRPTGVKQAGAPVAGERIDHCSKTGRCLMKRNEGRIMADNLPKHFQKEYRVALAVALCGDDF